MVDNNSNDGSVEYIKKEYPGIKIICNLVNNYCRANNLGVLESKAEYVAFLNNDTEVDKRWLIELVKLIDADKSIGAVGSKILFKDGRIDSAGHKKMSDFYWIDRGHGEKDAGQYEEESEIVSVSNCASLYRKGALLEVGLFDEDLNMYMEDVDVSIRLKTKRWRIVYAPKSIVFHLHHGTARDEFATFYTERNRLLLIAKHYPEKLAESIHKKIEEKNSIAENLAKEIDDFNKALNSKDSYINNLLFELSERNEILSEKDKYIASLENAIAEKDKYIANLEDEIGRHKNIVQQIYNSRTYRLIVRPLCALFRWKNAFSGFKARVDPGSLGTDNRKSIDLLTKSDTRSINICTIISKNYLSYARVLANSFLEHNKGEIFVLLTDKIDGFFDYSKERFTIIEIEELKDKIPNFNSFCFQYNSTELNTAVKPFFLEFLFEKFRMDKLVFLDPDILVTDSFDNLRTLLDNNSLILIPHITEPYTDVAKPSELHILKSGVYNLGFLGLSYTKTTKQLLKWWKGRLQRFCISDVENGLFVDQKWMDLVPGFFEDIFILRDTSYNIAYWNFHYRKCTLNGTKISIDGRAARFLHFSGFDPNNPENISRHQERFVLKDLQGMGEIFSLYKNKLQANGYEETKNWPCVFNHFGNGAIIPDVARRMYWEMVNKDKLMFGNPFCTESENSYFKWLNKGIDRKYPVVTNLMLGIYNTRNDLQEIYKDIKNADRNGFVAWFLCSSRKEYRLSDQFLREVETTGENILRKPFAYAVLCKAREAVKSMLKPIFKSNLKELNKLRKLEMKIYGKFVNSFMTTSKAMKNNNVCSFSDLGVNVIGYINGEHGVGEAVRANIKCLKAANIGISLSNINPTYVRQSDVTFSDFSNKRDFPINLIHINADMLPYHYAEKGIGDYKNKYNIGFWTWELSEFPDSWVKSFSYCDEVWVPSNFVLASISRKSPIPVLKIPHAVCIDNIKDVKREYFGLNEEEFIFLFIFDFLSYFERKNPLAVIRSFCGAFTPQDNTRLVIKCVNSTFDPKAFNRLQAEANGKKITIIDNYLDKDEVNALLALCNSYVSLHRSEGYGLTIAEAMSLGKPVIATGYSGNTDFMNINNSFPVRYTMKEIVEDVGPYRKGNFWAEPDIGHASELMRYVYHHNKEANNIGLIASEYIRNNLNFLALGSEMKSRIEAICR